MNNDLKVNSSSTFRQWVSSTVNKNWIYDVLLILIILVGGYFRLVGVQWDGGTHLHPDERYLTMVETSISSVKSIADYFNSSTSSLNPANRGYSFFVYGTLPIFIVRYVGEAFGKTGYDQIDIVGRQLSAIADLLTVLLIYLIGTRLYNRKVGILAAAFLAFCVLPIQLSHYFTVDTFTNFFGFLTVYIGVVILKRKPEENHVLVNLETAEEGEPVKPASPEWLSIGKSYLVQWLPYMAFGVALGMATASKINAIMLALLLPLIEWVRLFHFSAEERRKKYLPAIINLIVAAIFAFLAFRVCQPYAFTGPSFFNMKLDPTFISSMEQLSGESNGSVDYPPALQWVGRSDTFSLKNLVLWGMGLSLGLLAIAGFLWMGWRIIKGEWKKHIVLWVWTIGYFAWQSIGFTKSMRYQMLVYPTLALMASWAVFELWKKHQFADLSTSRIRWLHRPAFWKVTAGSIAVIVLVTTCAWAFAFTRIYTQPLTRVAASEWIYQNVPGSINLQISTTSGNYNQPLNYRAGYVVEATQPFVMDFIAQNDGLLSQIQIPHIVDTNNQTLTLSKTLNVTISAFDQSNVSLGSASLIDVFSSKNDVRGDAFTFQFANPIELKKGTKYVLEVALQEGSGTPQLMGNIVLTETVSNKEIYQSLPEPVQTISTSQPYTIVFDAKQGGSVSVINLPHLVDQTGQTGTKTLKISIVAATSSSNTQYSTGTISSDFGLTTDGKGSSYKVTLDKPLAVTKDAVYTLTIEMISGQGEIAVYGSSPALESSWDDALPQPVDGYSPYDYNYGIYENDLNFEMYWDDNADKLKKFETTLDQADTIFISSNRQWATTVRVAERYPLTTAYYRNLLGCPADKDITWCYSVAQPGMFTGNLGYKLVAVFQSNPNIGSIQINDQFAEEAFTVYDHPKVLIFEKESSYDPQKVRSILGAIDLSNEIHVAPKDATVSTDNNPSTKTLMLSSQAETAQQTGGTWTDIFNWNDLQNKYQVVAVILWYLVVMLLGLAIYPLVRITFPSLADRGYPYSRLIGLLLLTFMVWMASSFNVSFSRLLITGVIVLLVIVGAVLAYVQRKELKEEWKRKKRYFLMIEGLALALFAIDLLIRLGNPDLWHAYMGGEKPMDFSYFQAIIKSTTFPPYDPWFGGGYINYYYYGLLMVGVLDKWLGIVPSIAYNLILPTLFSIVGLGAFSFGWNISNAIKKHHPHETAAEVALPEGGNEAGGETDLQTTVEKADVVEEEKKPDLIHAFTIGLSSVFALLILGNLGTIRMIWEGFEKLVAPNGDITSGSIFLHIEWIFQGFFKFLSGTALPYGGGDWYWIPSRAISTSNGYEITEFPFFSFIYADLHAHLIALGITILALGWALAIILGKAHWGEKDGRHAVLSFLLSFFIGALVIGTLHPTNTWDYPTYLALGVVALMYTLWRYYEPRYLRWTRMKPLLERIIVTLGLPILLAGLSWILFEPFTKYYGAAYNSFQFWTGDRTPLGSYLIQWGLFLFVIIVWMGWETYDWMRNTPLRSLAKLRPYLWLIQMICIIWIVAVLLLSFVVGVPIAWLVLLLATWAAVLILRPGQPDLKRAVLFMIGTGLILTLVVELIVLKGDLGRMNTIFKFYYQTWTLFALSSAAGLGWIIDSLSQWKLPWRRTWQVILTILVICAALYPLTASLDKIRDRISSSTPLTLNGMDYMQYSTYTDPQSGKVFQLSDDYQAILWMQQNVKGSPIIVEGNTPEYRWGSRFTIYTGLPGVVGWNWHQRQQRAILPETVVTNRIADIATFYNTTDRQTALDFLQKYDVQYIIVGQLENAYYDANGLAKFSEWNGDLWQQVFQSGSTIIYKVKP